MDNDKQSPTQAPSSSGTKRPAVVLEPYSVVTPVPWYKKILGAAPTSEMKWRVTFLALLIISLAVTLQVKNTQTVQTNAAIGHASINLLPAQGPLSTTAIVQVWLTSDASITSGSIDITFDPNLVKLSRETVPDVSKQFGTIAMTPMNTSNTTGDIRLTLTPQSDSAPAIGTFQLASFTLVPNTAKQNVTTALNIVTNSTRLFHDRLLFNLSSTNGSVISVNPSKYQR
ncbi:MAG TPA: hypothetical protein VMR81_02810 [Patescibacteria group bacterium]|nr:hypothetical protein [Patescibacteria group bacterium]